MFGFILFYFFMTWLLSHIFCAVAKPVLCIGRIVSLLPAGLGCYSSRIASTGLMLMARMAGAKPAKTPSTERKMVAPTAVQKLI